MGKGRWNWLLRNAQKCLMDVWYRRSRFPSAGIALEIAYLLSVPGVEGINTDKAKRALGQVRDVSLELSENKSSSSESFLICCRK